MNIFFPCKRDSLVHNLNSSELPREGELVYLALVLSTLSFQFFLLSLVLPSLMASIFVSFI